MPVEFVLLLAIGFVAQLVDGTLGMAYGVLTNAALLTMGLPPAQASALVHTAEVFTTGASAASHLYHRNVDWRMVARLGVTGVLGAILGAWLLSNIEIGAARRIVSRRTCSSSRRASPRSTATAACSAPSRCSARTPSGSSSAPLDTSFLRLASIWTRPRAS